MNMFASGTDIPKVTIETKEDRRFSTSSRRLSTEMSIPHSSVEVYYGGAPVAIPFKWESQPGTPRVRFHEIPLPPLTPPPSVLFNSLKTPSIKNSKPKGLLRRLTPTRKSHSSASAAASESSSFPPWSYSDSASSPLYTPNCHRRSRRRSFKEDGYEPPVSTLCFRISRRV